MSAPLRRLLQQVRQLVKGPAADLASDSFLLEKFVCAKDEDAFAELFARHGPMVFGVCHRLLGDRQAAEDAFQATFLVLARKAGSIRPKGALAAWLYGVARRVALKAGTANNKQRHRMAGDLKDTADPRADPLAQITARELLVALDEEIERLPQGQRLAVLHCCLEGKTQEEAARQLGWSAGAIKGRLERGRARLQARLAKRGLVLSAGLGVFEVTHGLAAALPPLLAANTLRAALAFASGTGTASAALSAEVAALVDGALKALVAAKAKTLLAFLLAGLVLTGAGLAATQLPAERPTDPPFSVAAPPPPEAAEPEKSPEDKQVRVDLYGDPLPPQAIARLGTVRFRTPTEADNLAFAPDGKTVAVSSGGSTYLFDAATGKRFKRLEDSLNRPAFSPDSKRLATWGQGFLIVGGGLERMKSAVRVWELAAKGKPRDYEASHVIWLGWSAKGEPLVVCQEEGAVSLRELASGRLQRFLCQEIPAPPPSSGAFFPCACVPSVGRLAVADKLNVIHIWDINTGVKRCALKPAKNTYSRALAFSSDGSKLAVLNHDTKDVTIWDTMTGNPLRTMAADHTRISTFAFALDGQTLATAGRLGIRFWDVATGREKSRSQGEGSNTAKIAFSADGKRLATLQDRSGAFHLWDVATGKRQPEPAGQMAGPWGIGFNPDGRRLATGGLDGTIHVWDLASSKSLFTIHRPGLWVRRVVFSRDGRSLFSNWTDNQIWTSDAATGQREHVIQLDDPERKYSWLEGWSLHLSTDGNNLVSFNSYIGGDLREGLIIAMDPAARKLLFRRRLPGWEFSIVSADTRLLALAFPRSNSHKAPGYGPIRLEKLASGELVQTFPELEGQTGPQGFSPDARLLAAWNNNYKNYKEGDPGKTGNTLRLWEVATAAEVLSLPLGGFPSQVAFSSNGRWLALSAPKQEIQIWDLAQGRELQRFKDFGAEVTSLAFSPDGRRLISGLSDSTLLVWEVKAAPQPKQPPSLSPPSKGGDRGGDLAQAWADLAGSDAPRAFRARWTLAAAGDAALPLLQKHLQPVRPADPKRLHELLADLDSQQFPVRMAAQKRLEELGELAAPSLRQALTKDPSLEMRRRVEALLDKLSGPLTRPDQLRAVRAAAVLEDIATPEAQKLLETLAQGAPDARLTQEAKTALQRLRLRLVTQKN